MKANTITERLSARRKGTCVRIIVDRPAETYKKLASEAGEIRKRTAYSVQLASYANRQPVRDAVASGEREAPTLPAWVARTEDAGNGLRFWFHANGTAYLALPVFGDKSRARVQWTRNGAKVQKNEIEKFLTAKETAAVPSAAELAEKGQAPFNTIKLENIANLR